MLEPYALHLAAAVVACRVLPAQSYAKTLVAFVNPDGSPDSAPGGTYMGEWFRGQRTGTGRFMFNPASKFKTYSGA